MGDVILYVSKKLSVKNAEMLIEKGVKAIVIACNTATAVAIEYLRQCYPDTPFVGLEPAVKPAALTTKSGTIAVLATARALEGELFLHTSAQFADSVNILKAVGEGFVEIVERGEESTPAAVEAVKRVVEPIIAAGADTVIVSTNTSGVRNAVRNIRAAGRRVGIALNPESSVTILKDILREIDEVMVMSVTPGASGQQFIPGALHKISVLNATRKKFKLNFKISVDGGINDKTAALCWNAGADMLVCGSYLAHAHDFPLAVQSLLKKESTK